MLNKTNKNETLSKEVNLMQKVLVCGTCDTGTIVTDYDFYEEKFTRSTDFDYEYYYSLINKPEQIEVISLHTINAIRSIETIKNIARNFKEKIINIYHKQICKPNKMLFHKSGFIGRTAKRRLKDRY